MSSPAYGFGGTEHGCSRSFDGLAKNSSTSISCAVRGVDENFAERNESDWEVGFRGAAGPGFQFPLFRLFTDMHAFKPILDSRGIFWGIGGDSGAVLARVPVAIHSEHGYELRFWMGCRSTGVLCHGFFRWPIAVFRRHGELRRYHSRHPLPSERLCVLANA